jgi:multidrug efflux pump subunit AcrB
VNNSIILIYIYEEKRKELLKKNKKIKEGDIEEIILDGSKSRLRPIVITTVTTVVGVIPLIGSSAI